jgi:hypothetical protein
MTSSTHHIISTKYNRALQRVPRDRISDIGARRKDALKAINYSGQSLSDNKSLAERALIDRSISRYRKSQRVSMGIMLLAIILVTYFLIFMFNTSAFIDTYRLSGGLY